MPSLDENRSQNKGATYKQKSRAVKKIDDILARLPLKTKIVIVDQMSSWDNETSKIWSNYNQLVCQSLTDYLKKQKAKHSGLFHKLLYELFDEKLQDNVFICWLARKLGIRPFILQTESAHWKTNALSETRGHKNWVTKSSRNYTIEWLGNSIITEITETEEILWEWKSCCICSSILILKIKAWKISLANVGFFSCKPLGELLPGPLKHYTKN